VRNGILAKESPFAWRDVSSQTIFAGFIYKKKITVSFFTQPVDISPDLCYFDDVTYDDNNSTHSAKDH